MTKQDAGLQKKIHEKNHTIRNQLQQSISAQTKSSVPNVKVKSAGVHRKQ